MRALVVDDETDVRKLIGLMLTRLGHQVREVDNGEKALELLRGDPRPDVVLLDWSMPGMDGLTTLKAIRTEDALSTLRVMMVTGMNDMDDVSAALDAGADEYLMKPISARALKEKLAILGL